MYNLVVLPFPAGILKEKRSGYVRLGYFYCIFVFLLFKPAL